MLTEQRRIQRLMAAPTLTQLFDQPYLIKRCVGLTTPPTLSPRELQLRKEKLQREGE